LTKFHGAPERFEAVADVVGKYFDLKNIKYVADVAGGQGMLCRVLRKQYNLECEVIDPREYGVKGVERRIQEYTEGMAEYYDLIIGLHPDQALKPVVFSALVRPTILIPCCNYWSSEKMGAKLMRQDIKKWYHEHGISYIEEELNIDTPHRFALITNPPKGRNSNAR